MKRILMIGTGGTIASGKGRQGLIPELSTRELLAFVPQVRELCEVDCLQLFSLDSTNLCPSHWLKLAETIRKSYLSYDGFVVAHGTDTMAYTAAALSYLIQGAAKPVVLTGAQKPISFDSTDSKVNLTDAFTCAVSDTLHGVMIVFNGKVIQGTRACKTHSKSYEAFSSINYPYLAVLQDGRILQYIENDFLPQPRFYDALDERVGLLKLIPGTPAALAAYMLSQNDGLIVESFGVGGIPTYADGDFFPILEQGIAAGKSVVITTQVQNEGSDVGVYQVGSRVRRCSGILEAFDMTTEAIVGKLRWILGQTKEPSEIRKLFYTPVAHDILSFTGESRPL
jgi:L-asparaginase